MEGEPDISGFPEENKLWVRSVFKPLNTLCASDHHISTASWGSVMASRLPAVSDILSPVTHPWRSKNHEF